MAVLIKVAGAAIVGSALGLVVKRNSPETSLFISTALAMLAVYMCAGVVGDVAAFLRDTARAANIPDASLGVVLKTVGVSIIARLSADACKEAGQAAAASGVELAGALSAVYIALPLMRTVLDMVLSLI